MARRSFECRGSRRRSTSLLQASRRLQLRRRTRRVDFRTSRPLDLDLSCESGRARISTVAELCHRHGSGRAAVTVHVETVHGPTRAAARQQCRRRIRRYVLEARGHRRRSVNSSPGGRQPAARQAGRCERVRARMLHPGRAAGRRCRPPRLAPFSLPTTRKWRAKSPSHKPLQAGGRADRRGGSTGRPRGVRNGLPSGARAPNPAQFRHRLPGDGAQRCARSLRRFLTRPTGRRPPRASMPKAAHALRGRSPSCGWTRICRGPRSSSTVGTSVELPWKSRSISSPGPHQLSVEKTDPAPVHAERLEPAP